MARSLSMDDLPEPGDLQPPDGADDQPTPPSRRRGAVSSKRRRGARSSTSSSEGSGKESRLRQIGVDLDQAFVLIGSALSPFAPLTGATLVARGPQGSDIVVGIARKDERVFRALLAISKYAVYGELAMFLGAIGVAMTVDIGQQSPNSFLVRRLVGDDILSTVYGPAGAGPAHPIPPVAVPPGGWAPAGAAG